LIVIQHFTLSPKFAKQASAYNAKHFLGYLTVRNSNKYTKPSCNDLKKILKGITNEIIHASIQENLASHTANMPEPE
jgi:hypothetical protein